MNSINVNSEIGKLKTVLLYEPGDEINNLTPNTLDELLFDDIPWLPIAKKEHNAFAKAFKDNNVEVLYLNKLVEEVLESSTTIKEQFIDDFIKLSDIKDNKIKASVKNYLLKYKNDGLVRKMISGIKYKDLDLDNKNIFITNPMPNLYFQRDPFSSIGNGVCINKMHFKARQRETLFATYLFKYHPRFNSTPIYYDSSDNYDIEGGDICVLDNKSILIGHSQRTSLEGIKTLAKRLFNNTNYEQVLIFSIPSKRTFMHLDTVFSQVDYDKFTVHKGCCDLIKVSKIIKSKPEKITKVKGNIEQVLSDILKKKIKLINCGGEDNINSEREQWSDGSNCISIAPGVVICYERNEITNKILKDNGIKVITIPSSELSRGRGGPRCMAMPLYREDL